MGVNSLPKTVTRQRRGCYLNPGPSAPESSTLTTRLPSQLQRTGSLDSKHVNSNESIWRTATENSVATSTENVLFHTAYGVAR